MEGKTIDARTAAFVLGTYAAEQSGRNEKMASSEIAVVGNYGTSFFFNTFTYLN